MQARHLRGDLRARRGVPVSAAEGVPLTRELLEALEADAAARCGGSSVEARRRKALNLMEACIAAGAAAPPTNAPEISTSLVDAAAPDAELASLLEDLREGAELWGERRADTWTQSGAENADKACDEVCARIHAHVEKVKREAREGRLRDMDVPTLHKVPKPEPVTAPDAELGRTTQGYRVAGEPVSDAVGAEFGRLIAERDALRDAQTRQSFMTKDWCLAAAEQEAQGDAELDRLLNDMQAACYDHAKGYDHGNPLDCAQCQRWVQAVHAHVAQVKREAREAREGGEKSGWLIERPCADGPVWLALATRFAVGRGPIVPTTDSLEALRFARREDAWAFRQAFAREIWPEATVTEHLWLPRTAPAPAPGYASGETGDLLDRMLAAHGAALSSTSISREERCAHRDHRDALKDEVLRLYRAATGEVVATGSIVNIWPHLGSVEVKVDRLPEPGTPVSLVLRRDKEGV